MKWINRLYIFFVAIMLTVTTGFGLAAFYPEPVAPNYPTYPTYAYTAPQSCYSTPQAQQSRDCQQAIKKQDTLSQKNADQQQQYEAAQKIYQNRSAAYDRNAVFLGITIGALFAILGIWFIKTSRLVAHGLLFASILTAIFARLLIGLASLGANTTGTSSPDSFSYIEFGILFILSVVIIVIGYSRLKEPTEAKAT